MKASTTNNNSTPITPRTTPTISSRRGSHQKLSLDLSNIPAMQQPAPITNTLLLTNLNDLSIFNTTSLAQLHALVSQCAPINTWAPLRSFRRIVISFPTTEDAKRVRAIFDGELVMGQRTRVFFGPSTPVGPRQAHLALPDAGKLFFISPPPSPPMGWEMRLEDAPNKQVHADDLAEALAKLNQSMPGPADAIMLDSPVSPVHSTMLNDKNEKPKMHSRSSTLIWHPEQHGLSTDTMLPSIEVMDFACDDSEEVMTPQKPIMAHTIRPPVELME